VVSVRDTFGNAVPNYPVVFRVTAGGGLFGAHDTVTVLSDSAGDAGATLRLGSVIGTGAHGVEVRGAGLGTPSVAVTADGLVPVAVVEVTPTPTSVDVGATLQLAATLRDSAGGILTGRLVRWNSSATGVASVDAAGKVTGVAAGDGLLSSSRSFPESQSSALVTVSPIFVWGNLIPPISTSVSDLNVSSVWLAEATASSIRAPMVSSV
jgi:uncharacterized protein YjdB